MKLKLFFFSLFFAFSIPYIFAQGSPNLTITGFIGPTQGLDTVDVDSVFPAFISIGNQDSLPYSGNIDLLFMIGSDTNTITQFATIQVSNLAGGNVDTSTQVILANSAVFGGGVNVMVVWPTANNAVMDSLVDSIYVNEEGSSSIPKTRIEKRITLYPNPASTSLNFKYGNGVPFPEELRISDAAGREVYFTEEEFGEVDLKGFSHRVIFCPYAAERWGAVQIEIHHSIEEKGRRQSS